MKLFCLLIVAVLAFTGCGSSALPTSEQTTIRAGLEDSDVFQATDDAVALCIDDPDLNCIEGNGDAYGRLLDEVPAVIEIYRRQPDGTFKAASGKDQSVGDALRDMASNLDDENDTNARQFVRQIERELN